MSKTMTSAQKLGKWVGEQVDKTGGPVPIETIFRQAVAIDKMVKLLPYVDYGELFYRVVFDDESYNIWWGRGVR